MKELKKDVKDALYEELKICCSANESDDAITHSINSDNWDLIINDCGSRIKSINETTVKYLIGLTNVYSRAILNDDKIIINAIAKIFNEYEFDIHSLDEKIRNMYPEIWMEYNLHGMPCASKRQEEILKIVFEHFGCPGELPTIENIYEKVSKFGIKYESNDVLPRIDTRNFTDPYNTGNYYHTALSNGLSLEQIIKFTKKIDMMMTFYNAPGNVWSITSPPIKISSLVPTLDSEIEQMYQEIAANLYKVECRRLYSNNMYLQSQLTQQTPSDTKPINHK